MQWALRRSRLAPEQIGYVNAHGTGTKLNDAIETGAVKQVFGAHAYHLAMSSTKSMIGHCLGAAGALESLFCVKALQEQVLPPTINYAVPDPALRSRLCAQLRPPRPPSMPPCRIRSGWAVIIRP